MKRGWLAENQPDKINSLGILGIFVPDLKS